MALNNFFTVNSQACRFGYVLHHDVLSHFCKAVVKKLKNLRLLLCASAPLRETKPHPATPNAENLLTFQAQMFNIVSVTHY
ncbi:hypothetical protein BCD64_08945 [Nostoc sp. MBR 210]|nr:hypothetical protein BCD64_08945 [Nostoc sp. MBR 210]